MHIQCHKCEKQTRIKYSPSDELPFDYDPGFFCEHCFERLNTDLILVQVMQVAENALYTAQDATGRTS